MRLRLQPLSDALLPLQDDVRRLVMQAELRFPSSFPQLETERLTLRELREDDAAILFEIHSDPITMRYWDGPPWTDPSRAGALVQRAATQFLETTSIRWGLIRRDEGGLIGVATLYAIDAQSLRAEIGYILHRDHWGHGYNHEALTRILDFGFDELGLRRVGAELDPRNEASARAVERLGFSREGLLREHCIVEGEISDSLLVGLLRSEWRNR